MSPPKKIKVKKQAQQAAASSEAPEPKAPTPTDRIQTIAKMIAAGLFEPRITPYELAKKWNLDTSTIAHDVTAAKALIMVDDESRDMITLKVRGLLQRSAYVAVMSPDDTMEPRDRCRALCDTANALARIFGIEAPRKIDVKQSTSSVEGLVLDDPIGAELFLKFNRVPSEKEIEAERERRAALAKSAAN